MTEKEAIQKSIEHWKELAKAKPKELIEAEDNFYSSYLCPSSGNCALCCKYDTGNNICGPYSEDDSDCPLSLSGYNCKKADSIYVKALDSFMCIPDYTNQSDKDAMVKRFRRRAKKMIKVLESLL